MTCPTAITLAAMPPDVSAIGNPLAIFRLPANSLQSAPSTLAVNIEDGLKLASLLATQNGGDA